MTNYLVNSPQTLLTGTTSNDLFQLNTGLAQSLYGIEGADEFSAAPGTVNYAQTIINGGAGNDTIKIAQNGVGADASATLLSLLGGGGSDLISAAISGSADRVLFQGGGDNDTIQVSLLSGGTAITINGNGGNDSFSATLSGIQNSLLAFGGGNDVGSSFILQGFNSSTLIGGGGNDLISASVISATNAIIAGDTNSEVSQYDGNDTITLSNAFNLIDSLVQGNGGDDVITVSGLGGGTIIAGNSGNDTINLTAIGASNRAQINGGAGNDVISAEFDANSVDLSINGGGGNDTITITSTLAVDSAFIFGGDGADKIQLNSNNFTADAAFEISYSNAGESNLSAFDTVSAKVDGGYRVADLYQSVATGPQTSQGTNVVANASGQVTFANTFELGVTARATAINALGTAAGSTYYFADGLGSQYLFVQGGSSGTSDDLLIKNSTGAISGITVAGRGAGLIGGIITVDLAD